MTDLPPISPDVDRLARKITNRFHVPRRLAVLAILVLVDDKIGDKVEIADMPDVRQVRLRDDFPLPDLLEAAGKMTAVQQFLAGVKPPPRVMRMTPEARKMWDEWTEGAP